MEPVLIIRKITHPVIRDEIEIQKHVDELLTVDGGYTIIRGKEEKA
jgi:hypothetical protein